MQAGISASGRTALHSPAVATAPGMPHTTLLRRMEPRYIGDNGFRGFALGNVGGGFLFVAPETEREFQVLRIDLPARREPLDAQQHQILQPPQLRVVEVVVLAEPVDVLVGAFLVSPYASMPSIARMRGLRVDVAPLAIVGGRDVIVGGRGLASALRRMRTPGEAIEVVFFDKATHAFDEAEASDLRVHFDAALSRRAYGMLQDYLGRVLARS